MSMQWENLISPVRLWLEDDNDIESFKNQFSRDYDRVIFSSAFRRLGKKTQVHPLASNDHIHNRLTHSLEVASVGRSLGLSVGYKVKEDLPKTVSPFDLGQIVQAACLAHDIGNPPFGHAGEEAIRSWFANKPELLSDFSDDQKDDFLNFEGNAQSFRIVTKLENNSHEGGMRLSYSTLATLLKYPWTTKEIKRIKKFSCFQSEKDLLTKVANRVGLIEQDDYLYCRHPLAFLAEAADDICYRILDLEDAHELSILPFDEVKDILSPLCSDDKDYKKIISSSTYSPRRKISYLRGKSIHRAIESVSDSFVSNYKEIMAGKFDKSADLIDKCSPCTRDPLNYAKDLAKRKIFDHPRKIELEIGSYTSLGSLLDTFFKAVKEQVSGTTKLSFKNDRVLKMMGINAPKPGENSYEACLRVLDYISGMTDSYATYMAKQVGGMAL